VRPAKQVLTDVACVGRFYTVIAATPLAGDDVIVTPGLTAGLTAHSVVRADLGSTRSTGLEVVITKRDSALIAIVRVGYTVEFVVGTALVELRVGVEGLAGSTGLTAG
jgi:hypothetical protein